MRVLYAILKEFCTQAEAKKRKQRGELLLIAGILFEGQHPDFAKFLAQAVGMR